MVFIVALTTTVVPNPLGIQPKFLTQNRCFTSPTYRTKKKLMLHSTATPGAPAQNFFPNWNTSAASCSVEFVLDDKQILQYLPIGKDGVNCIRSWHCGTGTSGLSGNTTHIATEVCEPTETQLIPINYRSQSKGGAYNRSYTIKRLQMELQARGYYSGSIDGSFGTATDTAVKAFQKANGLTADGVVGESTRKKLCNRNGSYYAYDVVGATPFFNAAYDKAVELFAFLCDYVGAKPEEIVCHQEGYRQGFASNHSDVEHWFPLHNKTMDNFRADVAAQRKGTYIHLTDGTVSGSGAPLDPLEQAYLDGIKVLNKANIVGDVNYWTQCLANKAVADGNVMALLRKSGQWFCAYSHHYGAHALYAAGIIMEDVHNYEARPYTYSDVVEIVKCMGHSMHTGIVTGYPEIIAAMVSNGIINTPDYWLGLTEKSELNQGNVKALIRQCGSYLCSQNYKFGVEVISEPIKMNSKDFWLGGTYNFTNTMYLVKALAETIEPLL